MSPLVLLSVLLAPPETVVIRPTQPQAECRQLKDKSTNAINWSDVEVHKALQKVADMTCETFTVAPHVFGVVTLKPSDDQRALLLKSDEVLGAVTRALKNQCVSVTRDAGGFRVSMAPMPDGFLKVIDATHGELKRAAINFGCVTRFFQAPIDAWKPGDDIASLMAGAVDILKTGQLHAADGVDSLELNVLRDGRPFRISLKLVP